MAQFEQASSGKTEGQEHSWSNAGRESLCQDTREPACLQVQLEEQLMAAVQVEAV